VAAAANQTTTRPPSTLSAASLISTGADRDTQSFLPLLDLSESDIDTTAVP
jgi:hypothetical protein